MKKNFRNVLSAAAILSGLAFPAYLNAADYSSFTENEAALKQISNLAMYQMIASQDNIANYGSTSVGSTGWYNYANTASIRNGFSGAIWYMQTENSNGNTEWALVDAPNYSGTTANDFYKLGLPRPGNANDVVNMAVTGTNFYTSYDTALMPLFSGVTADADGVKSIQNSTLLIESWPFNYNSGTKASVLDQNGNTVTLNGASGGDYDWNDTPNKDGDHGSFQLHIYDAANSKGQTIIGMGRLYRPKETFCVGIGNSNSGTSKDWTMAEPTSKAGSRVFQVLALPNYLETDRIFNGQSPSDTADWSGASSWLGADGNTASVPGSGNDVYVNLGHVKVTGTAAANILTVGALGSITVTETGNLTVSGTQFIGSVEVNHNIDGTMNSAGNVKVTDYIHFGSTSTPARLNITGGNFSAGGLYLGQTKGGSAIANVENAVLNMTANRLYIGHTGQGEMTVRDSKITSNEIYVGNQGSGTLTLTGENSIQGNVSVAHSGKNSTGTMNMYDGTTITGNNFNVGYQGNGTLNMYGGSIKTTGYVCIGNNQSTAFGTVNQYGGTVESVWVPLGHNGQGVWNMYGGHLLATNTGGMDQPTSANHGLQIGDRAGSNVTFNLYDGKLESKGQMHVGRVGTGVLNQTGGEVVTGSNFLVGHLNGGNGTYNMSGGTLNSGGYITIGYQGVGEANFSGNAVVSSKSGIYAGHTQKGTITISDNASVQTPKRFSVAENTNSVGELNLYGGSITALEMAIGTRGSATFNMYDGKVKTTSWFLIGFNDQAAEAAPNVINQYGGTIDVGWFTMAWDGSLAGNAQNTYNMFGGTLIANGQGNPVVLSKNGKSVFNLFDGNLTLKTAASSNQTGNESQFIGYSLKIGAYNSAVSQMNIYAGDIKAGGKVSMNANSALNFTTSVKGLGTLAVEGAFEQNGGAVTVSHADGLSFTDNYSLQNGKDIMTVGGKSALTVTNNSSNILTTSYSQDTGALNVKFNDSLYLGSMNGINDSLTFDPAAAGWVSLDDFGGSDPYNLTMMVDTNDLGIENFVNALNEQINPQDDLWITVEALDDTHVSMTFMPDLADIDTISWDFTNTDIYGALGVSVSGLSMGQVPEPSAWVLLALGCGLLGMNRIRRRKNA